MSDYADFRADEHRCAELQAALRQPVIAKAIALTVAKGLPVKDETLIGVSLIEFNALQNARREGYYEFYRTLIDLADPLVGASAATRGTPGDGALPWEYAGGTGEDDTLIL